MKDTLFAVGLNELLGRTLDVSIQSANFFSLLRHDQLHFLGCEAAQRSNSADRETSKQAFKLTDESDAHSGRLE